MTPKRPGWQESLWLGYSFGEDREATFLVYINYSIIVIFLSVLLTIYTVEDELLPVTYRYHSLVLIGLLNLWLLKKKMVNAVRILILVSLPLVILILPPLGGIYSDEFYFWFPYVPLGMSVIPHFILHPFRHRIALFLTLGIYLLLGLFIDNYLIATSDGSETIIPFVKANQFYYKLIPVFLFLFVNATLRVLFVMNQRYRMIMQSQQEELLQSEKMSSLGILTSGLAHEINNPLNFISGSLIAMETLKEELMKPGERTSGEKEAVMKKMEELTQKAFEGVQRATDIISKLEFFANPDVKQDQVEISLEDLINRALRSIESKLPYYINIESTIAPDLRTTGNEQRLRLVLTHILRNAVDAMESSEEKPRQSIRIKASRESRERRPFNRISVLNSGPPIPEKDLKHIFDPFFSSRDPGDGVGLGMSISYMIIKDYGGLMEIGNKNGMVCVDVFLPAWVEAR